MTVTASATGGSFGSRLSASGERPEGATGRVAAAQREARRTLAVALAYAFAAAVSAVIPHDTGTWLPLHLLLAGALTLAVSGVAPLLAVGWSAGPAVPARLAFSQRWLLAGGVAGLAWGREAEAPISVLAAAGSSVVASLILLALALGSVARGRVEKRFDGALRSYAAAIASALIATALGLASFRGGAPSGWRDAHVVLNLLGFLGLVIAGTLPFFVATQARTKRPARATVRAQDVATAVLICSVAMAAAGPLAGHRAVAAIGYAGYAAGLLLVFRQLPWLPRRKASWGGPRLVMTWAALVWWFVAVVMVSVRAARGVPALAGDVLVVLGVGGFAQLLAASLAYLGPVLRGGGHERLSAGFAATRSWTALASVNAGLVLWIFDLRLIAAVAFALWVLENAWRSARLVSS